LFAASSYGALKLLPFWDPLRDDPRFEKIVASLAPKKPSSSTTLFYEKKPRSTVT
jgi:hypothetical protein